MFQCHLRQRPHRPQYRYRVQVAVAVEGRASGNSGSLQAGRGRETKTEVRAIPCTCFYATRLSLLLRFSCFFLPMLSLSFTYFFYLSSGVHHTSICPLQSMIPSCFPSHRASHAPAAAPRPIPHPHLTQVLHMFYLWLRMICVTITIGFDHHRKPRDDPPLRDHPRV
jgi:hypothetical protein